MKRLGSLYKKDIILGIKDVFIILELVFAVLFMLLLVFVIPKDIRTTGKAYIYDETKLVETFVLTSIPDADKKLGEYYVDSRDEVIAGMIEDTSSIGVIITGQIDGKYGIQLLTQPYTKQAMVNWIDIDMEDLMAILHPPKGIYPAEVYRSIRITALKRGERDILPFNQRILPPILFWMVGLMGLFAMVSIIGQERIDMTIRAYRLTPAALWEFLLSKFLVILTVGIISFSIFYIPLMGISGYLSSLIIIILTILMGSSIGVILASFFDSPMAALGWVLLFMAVFGLPAISLLTPSFTPDWMKFIPSYYTLFGLDAAMFPDYNSKEIIGQSAGILSALSGVLIIFST